MNPVEDADEVYCDDAKDLLEWKFIEVTAHPDTGVVMQDVHPAAGGRAELRERPLIVRLVCDVQASYDAIVGAQFRFERTQSFDVYVVRADEPSLLFEQSCGLAAHAGSRAGDKDRFAAVGHPHGMLLSPHIRWLCAGR